MAAAGPVVLKTNVHCYKCAGKIREAVANLPGVERVRASPEQGLVVVHGTADAYALRRRIRRKMRRHVDIVSDGSSEPYYHPGTTMAAPHYGHSQLPAYGWAAAAPPTHAYYSHPPPVASYPYAAGGYGAGWADPDPYGHAEHSTVPTCSIL